MSDAMSDVDVVDDIPWKSNLVMGSGLGMRIKESSDGSWPIFPTLCSCRDDFEWNDE